MPGRRGSRRGRRGCRPAARSRAAVRRSARSPPTSSGPGVIILCRRPGQLPNSLGYRERMLKVASRANVPPFHVMDLLAAAAAQQRSHGDLLNLVAGQPSTPAPRPVREAAKRALDSDVLGYTVALGIPGLREE